MHNVHVIPFSGKPLELDFEGAGNMRFLPSAHGFLLGKENGILEPLFQEIIDGRISPERQPILLYGALGSGRSHLLKGILETWRKNQTNESIRRQSYYLSCADFYRQFTDAIATRNADAFQQRFRRAKLLLLDDLEQLLGKSSAQAELRLLLDDFSGIIVLTAQTLPHDIDSGKTSHFSADLADRIQGGTTIPLLPPGEAVRHRFLRDLASALRIPVSEPLLNKAAKELTGTIPQLYAAVVQKYVEAKSANEPLEAAFWQQFSQKQKSNAAQNMLNVAKRTAAYFSLKVADVRGDSRSKTVVLARSIAVYLAKTQLRLTFKEIGHFFGKRDPSTVRHLFEKIQRNLQADPELRDHLFRLEKR